MSRVSPTYAAIGLRPFLGRSVPICALAFAACAPPAPKAAPAGPTQGETELTHLRAETVRLEERLRLALEERDSARAAAGRCAEAAPKAAEPAPVAVVSEPASPSTPSTPEEPRLVLRAEGDDVGEILTAEPEAPGAPGTKPSASGASTAPGHSASPKRPQPKAGGQRTSP